MKHIVKGSEPYELQQWFKKETITNGKRVNCGYKEMPTEVKDAVKRQLLKDQGWLCCYTGQLIDEFSSHIEHFKPQKLCVNYEDIKYNNLLAALPGANKRCSYGAKAKADWYDKILLVNPLDKGCEQRFLFNEFGKIYPAENDLGAKETIEHLKLDHSELTALRRSAIETVLIKTQPSKKQLFQIIKGYSNRDGQGKYRDFCFVIQQVAKPLLEKAERKHKRKQSIESQKKKKNK